MFNIVRVPIGVAKMGLKIPTYKSSQGFPDQTGKGEVF